MGNIGGVWIKKGGGTGTEVPADEERPVMHPVGWQPAPPELEDKRPKAPYKGPGSPVNLTDAEMSSPKKPGASGVSRGGSPSKSIQQADERKSRTKRSLFLKPK